MTPITPIRAASEWSAPAHARTPPGAVEETDQVVLTEAAQAILDDPPDDLEAALPEPLLPEDADTEEIDRSAERVLDALVLSRLQQADSRIRGEGEAIPADARLQLGPDDRWYVVGGGAGPLEPMEGPTEFGPTDHLHGEDCAYCARAAARFEAIGGLSDPLSG